MIIIYHLHMPFSLLGHLLKYLFIVNFHLQYKKKNRNKFFRFLQYHFYTQLNFYLR
jgi:hypothetical protein